MNISDFMMLGFGLALQIGLPVVLIGITFKLIHIWN